MNKEQLQALARILDYLKDEKADFEKQDAEGRENHIYPDIYFLEQTSLFEEA